MLNIWWNMMLASMLTNIFFDFWPLRLQLLGILLNHSFLFYFIINLINIPLFGRGKKKITDLYLSRNKERNNFFRACSVGQLTLWSSLFKCANKMQRSATVWYLLCPLLPPCCRLKKKKRKQFGSNWCIGVLLCVILFSLLEKEKDKTQIKHVLFIFLSLRGSRFPT